MVASRFDFVNLLAAHRNLVVTSSQDHASRLEPRVPVPAWYCDLDDGTPTGDTDPASFVRWVCPALRIGPSTAGTTGPLVEVRRAGPHSDLGKLLKRLGRLAGRASRSSPGDDTEKPFVYTDPAGILDSTLRRRIENWPAAPHGDGVVRPAELWAIKCTREGLVVESVSWWNSAPALDHQIGLAIDIAGRLTALRQQGSHGGGARR